VADEVRAGRSERLEDLAPAVSELVVRLLADDETAGRLSG
jgi:hypothetical protein